MSRGLRLLFILSILTLVPVSFPLVASSAPISCRWETNKCVNAATGLASSQCRHMLVEGVHYCSGQSDWISVGRCTFNANYNGCIDKTTGAPGLHCRLQVNRFNYLVCNDRGEETCTWNTTLRKCINNQNVFSGSCRPGMENGSVVCHGPAQFYSDGRCAIHDNTVSCVSAQTGASQYYCSWKIDPTNNAVCHDMASDCLTMLGGRDPSRDSGMCSRKDSRWNISLTVNSPTGPLNEGQQFNVVLSAYHAGCGNGAATRFDVTYNGQTQSVVRNGNSVSNVTVGPFTAVTSAPAGTYANALLIMTRAYDDWGSSDSYLAGTRQDYYPVTVIGNPSCIGVPANATLCSGDDAGLAADTSSTVVATCGAAKCEYTCNAGYQVNNNNCVPIVYSCLGVPNNATLCPEDSEELAMNINATDVGSSAGCTAAGKCEYYYPVCRNQPQHATLCPGDDTSLYYDRDSVIVTECSEEKCEFICNAGYQENSGVCKPITSGKRVLLR